MVSLSVSVCHAHTCYAVHCAFARIVTTELGVMRRCASISSPIFRRVLAATHGLDLSIRSCHAMLLTETWNRNKPRKLCMRTHQLLKSRGSRYRRITRMRPRRVPARRHLIVDLTQPPIAPFVATTKSRAKWTRNIPAFALPLAALYVKQFDDMLRPHYCVGSIDECTIGPMLRRPWRPALMPEGRYWAPHAFIISLSVHPVHCNCR